MPHDQESGDAIVEGLRERKKRLTHQLISDTATALFLEHGFDQVKVADVAEACGVSEKTIYNYFATKESLVLDREGEMSEALRHALGPEGEGPSPIEAVKSVLARNLEESGTAAHLAIHRRFSAMVQETPSLRAAFRDMSDRLVQVAAGALADRAGVNPEDPEPQVAAAALLGLWQVQNQALLNCDESLSAEAVCARATEAVDRAARLLEAGLWTFDAYVRGAAGRDEFKSAAEAAQRAARQVANAVTQARKLWVQLQREGDPGKQARDEVHRQWREAQHQRARAWQAEAHHWREAQREQVRAWRETQRQMAAEWRRRRNED